MTHPCFFGYGSLVNRATHDYPNAHPALATGWRRAWVHTHERPYAFLSAIRAANGTIQGLIADVPNADWAALDLREHAYERIEDGANISHPHAHQPQIAIYAVPAAARAGVTQKHPILLSYLEVVVQGYLQEFGQAGVDAFCDSTDGWDAPILDDRDAPIYPRAQVLNTTERSAVERLITPLGTVFKP